MAALTPVIFNTTETAIARFTPHERGCYSDDEFKLKIVNEANGYKYSLKNCFNSAVLEKIVTNCSCAPQIYGTITDYHHLFPCR